MLSIQTALAGVVTIVLLVSLGIFIYPWLLKRKNGAAIIAAATVILFVLYFAFDRGYGTPAGRAAGFGLLWACAPIVAALIVHRIGAKAAPREMGKQQAGKHE